MKIVVIGGTGLIGSKLVQRLGARGQEVLAASPSSGVNTLTGAGLDRALDGAQVVVDVTNSPSFDERPAMEFFSTSTRNLLAAEAAAGVGHHVALSVVGTDRLLESGYFRAKLKQETLIRSATIPYSIVRATQFFEFTASIADAATDGDTVRVPPALMQPMLSDEVADGIAEVALAAPLNGMVELGGPERIGMDDLVARYLRAHGDRRRVITDPQAQYFGLTVNDQSLTAGPDARIAATRYDAWLARAA